MTGAPSSIWSTRITQTKDGPVATFIRQVNLGTPLPFTVKGICYSPCPIGSSNNFAAIGDFFWDSVPGLTSWQGTWSQDLPMIKALGVNVIRVYSMIAYQNSSPLTDQVFTHTNFLDACHEAGLYVLVGLPLPIQLFCLGQTPSPDAAWWSTNITATVSQMADHPAVMGFTMANEVDNGSVDTYGPTANAEYWWGQVQAIAAQVKQLAPTKLVGIANHDDSGICLNCQSYMAQCPDIDFWGVNSYQPQTLAPVFGGTTSYPTGYATLTGTALKPVLLSEYGFPATSRPDALDPTGIYSDTTTEGRTAAVLAAMIPQAYQQAVCAGVCYFEYCDEWWNQSSYSVTPNYSCPGATPPDAPAGGAGGSFAMPNIYTWYGGPIACGFPNYYWDQDGFGLYSVAVGTGRDPATPWDTSTNAPALPLDQRIPRQTVINALMAGWPS